MRRLSMTLAAAAALALLLASPVSAEFGLHDVDVRFSDADGSVSMQAGSHPFAMTSSFEVNTVEEGPGEEFVDGAFKDLQLFAPAGLVANPTATPRCSTLDFLTVEEFSVPSCPNSSAVGFLTATLGTEGEREEVGPFAVYNLEPQPGSVAKLGFWIQEVPQTVDLGLNPDPPYNGVASLRNLPQVLEVFGSDFTLWGNPADAVHDPLRGRCAKKGGSCPAEVPVEPYLTLPRSCTGPLRSVFRATSWWSGDFKDPGPPASFETEVQTHDDSDPPQPLGNSGCSKLGFEPQLSAQPTSHSAESPSGLDVSLEVDDEGLTNPSGIADSDIKKALVTLPPGVTANPSLAEGLGTCSLADLDRETLASAPGAGCPEASKIGTVEVESELLEGQLLHGELFIATQDDPGTAAPGAENPFDTLLALYVVIKHPAQGILVKLAGKVEPDPQTGQLVTTFGDPDAADPRFRELPQLPFSHFRLRFREGGRSPLITPPRCGTFETKALLTPWANPSSPLSLTSSFAITAGVGGGPCPPDGPPPFAPGFTAGTLNNSAASFSPFNMRLTRRDGDQDLTRFSSVLPPGLVGKLAGVESCADAAIAAAKGRTGRQELASPSCPAGSQIGRTLAGAGVGSQLTYVPGKLYLAGPVGRAPLSVVAIVPAVAGPFDAGTVVVREALRLNPVTAEVEVDGANSDPIPHILKGIPLKVRDLRVYVDRDRFILNPTSCDPMQTQAQLWGGGVDPFSVLDDSPVSLSARFQAANCSSLGFKPRLSIRLKGRHQRGGHPALTAILRPRAGDANLKRTVLRFPRSTFLDQGHIRTVCTRVQFAADSCPQAAIYGHATAFTPLLEQPLTGPVYLRSSDNLLPDLVFDLHGLVDVEAAARADSIKGKLRVTFGAIPDAPVSKVVVQMQGAKKGLLINSADICAPVPKAALSMEGHNGKALSGRVAMRSKGCRGKRAGSARSGR